MSQKIMSESAYIAEFETVISHLTTIVENENEALEQGNIKILSAVQNDKFRLTRHFNKMWVNYKTHLKNSNGKRQEAFASLADQLDDFKDLMAKNLKLLSALKVNSANRIDAGMKAWRRQQSDTAPSYGRDGYCDNYRSGPNTIPSRLI